MSFKQFLLEDKTIIGKFVYGSADSSRIGSFETTLTYDRDEKFLLISNPCKVYSTVLTVWGTSGWHTEVVNVLPDIYITPISCLNKRFDESGTITSVVLDRVYTLQEVQAAFKLGSLISPPTDSYARKWFVRQYHKLTKPTYTSMELIKYSYIAADRTPTAFLDYDYEDEVEERSKRLKQRQQQRKTRKYLKTGLSDRGDLFGGLVDSLF